jgi:ABC-2 type transport system permease protein
MIAFQTLLKKEIHRFWKVAFQTVAAPVLTALMYLLIFSHVMAGQNVPSLGAGAGAITYVQFLIPGLAMMSMLQNAFANSSSSLIQSKITGNILFVLLPPLSHWDFFNAYVLASIVRGLAVGLGVFFLGVFAADLPHHSVLWIVTFAILGCTMMGSLGIIAGLWADKFDEIAAFQNFIIMPLTFLSGVFYSLQSLPAFWKTVSHLNPFFYLIDGFRYGFFGASDASPWLSLSVAAFSCVVLASISVGLLKSGYKLRT